MNIVGEIGNFMMIYQEPLEVVTIAILTVAVVMLIGKAIASAGKKRRMIEDIHETVSEINANVKALGDKKTEVIYIESRGPVECGASNQNEECKSQVDSQEIVGDEKENDSVVPEEKQNPALKYFSRDCAVAKDGRQYTLEELDAQIRD